MQRKHAAKHNKTGLYLLFAAGASLALALVLGPTLFTEKGNAGNLASTTSTTPMIVESIERLSSAESSSHRMNAARWLSTQYATSPDAVIRSLSESLSNDPDPIVRAQAATSLGQIALQTREKPNANRVAHEKQIASVLQKQYAQEASDAVRRCIVGAAAELDGSEAGQLLDKAITDNDPAVKEEALRARLERERRAQLKKLG